MTNGDSRNAQELAELEARVQQLKSALAAAPVVSQPAGSSPIAQKQAFWNILALLSPVLVGPPAIVVSGLFIDAGGWNWGAIGRITFVVVASSFLGLAASIVAMVRGEQRVGITSFAFFTHVVVLLLVFAFFFLQR